LIGAGSEDGWVPNSVMIWKGTSNQEEDYLSEMNSDVMNHWSVKYLLPNVERNSILLLDRVPYQTFHLVE